MNKTFTITRTALHLFSTMLLMICGNIASAQVNIALTATSVSHGPVAPGTGTGSPYLPPSPTPPAFTWGFGPYHYNDNYIPPYLSQGSIPQPLPNPVGPNLNFTYVTTGGWIKWSWATAVTFNKIVIYKNDRPINSFDLQVGGGLNYTTIYTYNNQFSNEADSIFFDVPLTVALGDTLRFNNVLSFPGVQNPSTREIQIWDIPACLGNPSANGVAIPPTTTPCFGTMVHLHSTSNTTTSNHGYQWQYSLPSAPTTWISIPGANLPGYSFQAIATANYRVVDTCKISAAFTASNPPITITPSGAPAFQPVGAAGYFQGFDNVWNTVCAVAPFSLESPGPGWTNNPVSGNNSWRREGGANPVTVPGTTPAASGWTNTATGIYPTPYAVPYAVPASSFAARFHTSLALPNTPGNLDMYLDCSVLPGDKQLYFYMVNQTSGVNSGDSLKVLMSLDSGFTWTLLAGYDTATAWRKKSVLVQSNSPKTIIRFQAFKTVSSNGTDIGLDSVFVAPPCAGAGTVAAGTVTMPATTLTCAGATFNMTTIGATMAGNLVYSWEYSTNGGVAWNPVNGGIGSNTHNFTTPPLYDTTMFRLKLSCGAGGTPATSNAITINVAKEAQYATIPYSQNFEATWISRCNTSTPVGCASCNWEVPSVNWANWPVTGNNSWRREVDGGQALWSNAATGATTAASPNLSHYARFHSTQATTGSFGTFDLLVNLSTFAGTKEVRFATHNTNGNDSLGVYWSTDGGYNFTPLATILSSAAGWTNYSYPLPSSSPTAVIRFKAYGEFATANTSDIMIDTVTVLPACTGTPNPGTVNSGNPCPNVNFTLDLVNSTFAGSLTYQWEESLDGQNWNPSSGTGFNTQSMITSIPVNTYFRVKVTCTNSNLTATTPAKLVVVAKFYYCYCGSSAVAATGADIGNVTVLRLPGQGVAMTNGNATPLNTNATATKTYSDFRGTPNAVPPNGVPPIVMYHDSTYSFVITHINNTTFTAASVSLWIDTNRNGTFDPTEQVMVSKTTSASSNPPQVVKDTITLTIDTTFIGITGMRVILESPVNPTMGPCGTYPSGETEDYLVELKASPCNGPVNPGVVQASDTSSCVGYTVTLVDTTHEEYRSDIAWVWQYSPDGFSWADIAGSQMRDTVVHIIQGQTFFRLQMLCLNTLDTTHTDSVKVSINPSYACYCFSQADGNNADSSDIASFQFGTKMLSNNGSGPHIKNANAFRPRTDFTKNPATEIYNDSMYQIKVYHILRSNTHGDAKITIFMDLNNDLMYNITPTYTELIYTGYTNASQFVLTDSIYVPPFAIPGSLTGMRIILNNNIGPNVPSDSACGTYTSGETEDYVIKFKSTLSVPELSNIASLALYPNPTEGRFNLTFLAKKPVEHATITVTNLTGQKLMTRDLNKPGKEYTQELNLTAMPRGVYFVEFLADDERLVRKVIVK